MKDFDWGKLPVFIAVVEEGSFSSAGKKLNKSGTSVSETIKALEIEMGRELFSRSTTGVVLTEDGEVIRKLVLDMQSVAKAMKALPSTSHDSMEGSVTIQCSASTADFILAPNLPDFRRDNDGLTVVFETANKPKVKSEYSQELVIGYTPCTIPGIIIEPVGYYHYMFAATQDFIDRYGLSDDLVEMAKRGVPVVMLDIYAEMLETLNRETYDAARLSKRGIPMMTDNFNTTIVAARSSISLAPLPSYVIASFDDLIAYPIPVAVTVPAFLFYPGRMLQVRRFREAVEWVKRSFQLLDEIHTRPAVTYEDYKAYSDKQRSVRAKTVNIGAARNT